MRSETSFRRLISAELDNVRDASSPPVRRLIICTSPRTAGHAMNEAFMCADWGVPMEYFNPNMMIPLQQRWLDTKVNDPEMAMKNAKPYGEALLKYRVRNNIFSAKIFPDQLKSMLQAFGTKDRSGSYVHLVRRDKVAQAISFAVLLLTKRPFDDDFQLKYLPTLESVNDNSMRNLFFWLRSTDEFWEQQLKHIDGQRVIKIFSEDFLDNPSLYLHRMATRFSFPLDAIDLSSIGQGAYKKDADLKAELSQRYTTLLKSL